MKSEQQIREGIERSYARHIWYQKHRHWFNRCMLLPSLFLAVAASALVIHGLVAGEIKEANRYSAAIVSLAAHPYQYWGSVAYHVVVASFLWVFTAYFWRGSQKHG